jgi:Uma2 family endonuclease
MSVDVVRRRFTVDEYLQMAQAGILNEDDRVELLDGEIVEMTPIGRPHAACVNALIRLLTFGAGSAAVVWVQGPVRLSENSQPEPDIALLRPRAVPYRDADVEPRDVLLLIEVSGTSLRRDRELKLPLYAQAGIREYWIVDVQSKVVEVYTNPSGSSYASVQKFRRGESVIPLAFSDLRIAVDEIFA